jgi:thiosulfate/3-mercaptopyruvate sulfurtransferase
MHASPSTTAPPSPLISAVDLAAATDHPLIIDVRPAEQFARGQIPGAVHLDLWGVSLVDTSEAPLRAFAWMIAHVFALRGVSSDRRVVIYEQDAGIRAARAFWWLEYLGHPHVQVLDGGFGAWTSARLPVSTDPVSPTPTEWEGEPQPARVATVSEVRERLGDRDTVIVDTRSRAEYTGELVRARRGGHIPGAVNIEWKRNLTDAGTFKSPADLRRMYETAGVTPDREVITYCQGGYRAAHAYLALRQLGYPRVRNYTGSWKEWGDSTNPTEN